MFEDPMLVIGVKTRSWTYECNTWILTELQLWLSNPFTYTASYKVIFKSLQLPGATWKNRWCSCKTSCGLGYTYVYKRWNQNRSIK